MHTCPLHLVLPLHFENPRATLRHVERAAVIGSPYGVTQQVVCSNTALAQTSDYHMRSMKGSPSSSTSSSS